MILNKVGKTAINYFIKEYGKMIDLKLDSSAQSVSASFLLKGEDQPIDIKAKNYEFIAEKGEAFLQFNEIAASREWLDVLAKEFIQGKKIAISEGFSRVLGILI